MSLSFWLLFISTNQYVYAEPEFAFFTGIGAEQAAPAPPKVDLKKTCFDLQYLTSFWVNKTTDWLEFFNKKNDKIPRVTVSLEAGADWKNELAPQHCYKLSPLCPWLSG